MPSRQEWLEAFERLEKGSSYEGEAKRLGAGKGTVHRHHMRWLERRIEEMRSELERLTAEVARAEQRLGGLKDEYARREQRERADLESKLELLKKQLELMTSQVNELLEEAEKRGLTLERMLDTVKRIVNIEAEVKKLEESKNRLWKLKRKAGQEKSLLEKLKSERMVLQRDITALKDELSGLFRLEFALREKRLVLPCKVCSRWGIYADVNSLETILRSGTYGGGNFRCDFCGWFSSFPAWEVAWHLAHLVLPAIREARVAERKV